MSRLHCPSPIGVIKAETSAARACCTLYHFRYCSLPARQPVTPFAVYPTGVMTTHGKDLPIQRRRTRLAAADTNSGGSRRECHCCRDRRYNPLCSSAHNSRRFLSKATKVYSIGGAACIGGLMSPNWRLKWRDLMLEPLHAGKHHQLSEAQNETENRFRFISLTKKTKNFDITKKRLGRRLSPRCRADEIYRY